MLEYLITKARQLDEVKAVLLHVQADNEEAKRFYEKRGFKFIETVDNYYKNQPETRAWVLRYNLRE